MVPSYRLSPLALSLSTARPLDPLAVSPLALPAALPPVRGVGKWRQVRVTPSTKENLPRRVVPMLSPILGGGGGGGGNWVSFASFLERLRPFWNVCGPCNSQLRTTVHSRLSPVFFPFACSFLSFQFFSRVFTADILYRDTITVKPCSREKRIEKKGKKRE